MRSLSKGAPLFASEDSKTISFLRIRTAREKCREVNRVWVLDLLLGRSWASNQSIVVDMVVYIECQFDVLSTISLAG